MQENRILWIDRMRGLAILSVVIQHLTYYFQNPEDMTYLNLITVCNMGVFFFVSGYIMDKTYKTGDIKTCLLYIKKKFLQLIIPFIFWGLLVLYIFSRSIYHISIDDLYNLWEKPHLWYLLTLFGYVIPFSFYKPIFYKRPFICKILFWITINLVLLFIWKLTGELKFATIYIPFFTFGVITSEYKKIEVYLNSKLIGTIAVISIFLFTNYFVSGSTSLYNSVIKIILTVAAIVLLYQLCNINWVKQIDLFISQCGIYSIAIYAVHWYFLDISFITRLIDTNNELIIFSISVFMGVIISYICILTKRALCRFYILDGLMFGGKWK